MRSFQAAHVDDNPENVGLPHQQCQDSQPNGGDMAEDRAAAASYAAEVVQVRAEDSCRGNDIGVVQGGEEEQQGEQGCIAGGMEGVFGKGPFW